MLQGMRPLERRLNGQRDFFQQRAEALLAWTGTCASGTVQGLITSCPIDLETDSGSSC